MRGPADRLAAVLDANVLYPFQARDVLLSLAEAGLYRPLWTAEINAEWTRSLVRNKPDRADAIAATVEAMTKLSPRPR